jgi:hypothetical protein
MAVYVCDICNELKDDDLCVAETTKHFDWVCEDCLPEIESIEWELNDD